MAAWDHLEEAGWSKEHQELEKGDVSDPLQLHTEGLLDTFFKPPAFYIYNMWGIIMKAIFLLL